MTDFIKKQNNDAVAILARLEASLTAQLASAEDPRKRALIDLVRKTEVPFMKALSEFVITGPSGELMLDAVASAVAVMLATTAETISFNSASKVSPPLIVAQLSLRALERAYGYCAQIANGDAQLLEIK